MQAHGRAIASGRETLNDSTQVVPGTSSPGLMAFKYQAMVPHSASENAFFYFGVVTKIIWLCGPACSLQTEVSLGGPT